MPALITIGGYEVDLLTGSGDHAEAVRESSPQNAGPRVSVRLKCSWAGRYTVWAGLLGSASGGPGSIYRAAPFAYPPSPNLYCLAIPDSQGVGYMGDWNFKTCHFTAEFGVPTYDIPGSTNGVADPSGVPWTTTRARGSAEVIQIPIGGYKFTSGVDSGKAVPESQIGLTVPHTEITLTRHLMPYVPFSEANAYLGKLNSVAVTLGNQEYAAGELLFNAWDFAPTNDGGGARTWEIVYTLLGVGGHTWNQVIDRDGQWVTINTETDLSGEYPFESADWWNNLP
jgi:hypothetical protein